MKIAFVFDDTLDNPDGIQQYMASLAGYYTKQGHEVHYLVGHTERTDIPNVHSLSRNFKVKFNGNRLSIPLWAPKKRVTEVLARERFDVLHVQVPYHPLMAGRIIKAASPETVVFGTFHIAPYSWLLTAGNYLLGLVCRRTLRRFNGMVCVSPAAQNLCRQTYHLQTTVVPNVFDYARFHDAEPLPQYADDIPTIVFLGRLVPRKGCQLLLEAISRLPRDLPMRVLICGGGPLEQQLQEFVLQHELSTVVTFVGRVSEADKPRYYASADIAAFPSSGGESFGIVLIEAMASGRAAVLGGNNPGYRSVLGERPEQLVSTSSADDLSAKLLHLLDNEAGRLQAAAWGEQSSKQYDVLTVGDRLLEMYQEVAPNSSNG